MIIGLLIVSLGCTQQSNNNILSFKYGVIFTSNLYNKSKIVLFSQNWDVVEEINLDIGGLQKGKIYKENLYVPVTGIPSEPGNKILEFNMKTGNKRYIKTKKLPIKLVVKDNFLYVIHNTSIDSGLLTKINIKNNNIIKEKRLSGVLREIAIANDKINVIADDPVSKNQNIYELDENLNEINIEPNKFTAFPTDSLYFNGMLLIINNAKYDFLGPTNKIVAFKSKNSSLELVKLKEEAPYQIFKNDDNIIITHYDFPTRSGNKVTVLNNELNQKKVYYLKNDLYLSHMGDNVLYSLDHNYKLYQYNINDFALLSEYQLKKIKGMVIADFFVLDGDDLNGADTSYLVLGSLL